MRVGFLQYMPVLGDLDQNILKISQLVQTIDADLLVLPELCNTGYHFVSRPEAEGLAEEVPQGKTTEALCRLAKIKGTHIVAGLIEKSGGRCYNAAVLVGPAGYVATYRKIHLFYEENLWFDPGEEEPAVHDIGVCRVGLMICFDWLFPETARILALKGADVICHSANLVMPCCQDAMVTRCLENRVFAVTANRIGTETRGDKSLHFQGRSQITAPDGSILYRAAEETEETRVVDIDPASARNKGINPYNNLWSSRKTECYAELVKRR
ncbi:MAG: acyltransferase [Deltaproteobacteria bacterium]|nr:acyltransferase [Deltaproteobacteria bacterium]